MIQVIPVTLQGQKYSGRLPVEITWVVLYKSSHQSYDTEYKTEEEKPISSDTIIESVIY